MSEAWVVEDPAACGFDAARFTEALADRPEHEAREARDMAAYLGSILASQEHNEVLGPLLDSHGPSGAVVRGGALVGTWGQPDALEMSFSVTKTYLGAIAGLAFDRGLIEDVDRPVGETVDDDAFAGHRHSAITWRHLLQQTSEWGGELWGKPYWADPQGLQPRDALLREPGSRFAYNDVRINLLALALTRLWRRGLEDVLEQEVLDPIGGSGTAQWHGYADAWIEEDGSRIPCVSGGAHWGGGLWCSAFDHARFGQLYLNRGLWEGRRILSEEWIDLSVTPGASNPDYGFLWWLNGSQRVFGRAPTTGMCARGNLGRQLIWVDPARDLVIVSRWTDGVGRFIGAVSDALTGGH